MDAYGEIAAAEARILNLIPSKERIARDAIAFSEDVGFSMLIREQRANAPEGAHVWSAHGLDDEGEPYAKVGTSSGPTVDIAVADGTWIASTVAGDCTFTRFADAYKFALQQLGVIE